ncbi:MAG TPA: phosphatase PAP2 family protein [Candidatus Acidoferrales bacterium]|nr:phosphatase PAP2 family protein [Candidatus Acidoferrales bacterium]
MSSLLTLASVYYGSFDYNITHLIRDLNYGGVIDMLFTYITFTGSTVFMVLIIVLLYIGGARKEALVFAVVFVVTNVLALGIKYIVARPRPSDLGVIPEAEAAFPSAHTANAFALTATISRYHRKFTIVMFAWALVIAFSRVFLGLHYFTDVIGGAVLGFVVSYVISRAALQRDNLVSAFVRHPIAFVRRLLRQSRRYKT